MKSSVHENPSIVFPLQVVLSQGTNDRMENLELSLSSLGTISRHIDKSHNELNQYLSKQVSCVKSRRVYNIIYTNNVFFSWILDAGYPSFTC